jgi:hypothetical protein
MDMEEDDDIFLPISKELTEILTSVNSLVNKLDTLKATLEEELFNFSQMTIQVHPKSTAMKVLCMKAGLQYPTFSVKDYLHSLNRWLVMTNQVNKITFDVVPNELTQKAFEIGPEPIEYLKLIETFPNFFEEMNPNSN